MAALNGSETPSCHLLDLPPKLRIIIYDFVYTTEDEEGGLYIDLLKTEPRSQSLLLACRQISNEVRDIYRASYRRYWDENNFYITHDGTKGLADAVWSIIKDFNDHYLRNMRRFHIKSPLFSTHFTGGIVELETGLCDTRGKWIYTEKTSFTHPMFSQLEEIIVYSDDECRTQLATGPYGALLARRSRARTKVSPSMAQQIMIVMGFHSCRMSEWAEFRKRAEWIF